MYDLYFMGSYVGQIPTDKYYEFITTTAEMYTGHWERNWDSFASEGYIFVGDNVGARPGKIAFRLIKV